MRLIEATVIAHGPRDMLRGLRKYLPAALREESPDTRVSEHHAADQLEFRLQARGGLPFPALVAASAQAPECVLEVSWVEDGATVTTTLRAGQAENLDPGAFAPGGAPCCVRINATGHLVMALALDSVAGEPLGYCVTGSAETFFRVHGTPAEPALYTIGGSELAWDEQWQRSGPSFECRPVANPQPLPAAQRQRLEHLAAGFRERWLWFAHDEPEQTAIERERYRQAGRKVAAINVKSRWLEPLRTAQGYSSLNDNAEWIAGLLTRTWAQSEQEEPPAGC